MLTRSLGELPRHIHFHRNTCIRQQYSITRIPMEILNYAACIPLLLELERGLVFIISDVSGTVGGSVVMTIH